MCLPQPSRPLRAAGSAHSTTLRAPASFPPLFLSLFLIMKIKEPVIPATAVTTLRLNHKLCGKCLVCRKSCSITYVSHYGVNLRKKAARSACRCKAKPGTSRYRLRTCSPARGGTRTETGLCHAPGGATPAHSRVLRTRGPWGCPAAANAPGVKQRCGLPVAEKTLRGSAAVETPGSVGDGGVCASPEPTCTRGCLCKDGDGEMPVSSPPEPTPPPSQPQQDAPICGYFSVRCFAPKALSKVARSKPAVASAAPLPGCPAAGGPSGPPHLPPWTCRSYTFVHGVQLCPSVLLSRHGEPSALAPLVARSGHCPRTPDPACHANLGDPAHPCALRRPFAPRWCVCGLHRLQV